MTFQLAEVVVPRSLSSDILRRIGWLRSWLGPTCAGTDGIGGISCDQFSPSAAPLHARTRFIITERIE